MKRLIHVNPQRVGEMCSTILLFDLNQTSLSKSCCITFIPYNETIGLPFPLYLNYFWRIIISLSFIITLVQGKKHVQQTSVKYSTLYRYPSECYSIFPPTLFDICFEVEYFDPKPSIFLLCLLFNLGYRGL